MASLRIGILTYHFSDNFGALMQAYGLKAWLASQGHHVEFINYHPRHVEEGGDFVAPWNPRHAKANAKIAYLKLSMLQRRLFGNRGQAQAFEAFRRDELNIAGPRLSEKATVETYLAGLAEPYDLIVVGSDQIWAASQQRGLDPVYFADFAIPPGTRKISYAPSFGRATVDAAHRDTLRQLLGGLDGISARERSGGEIVRQLTGRDVTSVPDPTLLLGDFSRAVAGAETTPSGHVFCYALRSGKGIREVAKWVGNTLGRDVISPYNVHRRWPEIGQTVYPSPKGWVALIDRAGFVVTNSFHGTVFSILQRRPFLVVGLPGARTSLNERTLNLLDEVGLRHRFVNNGDMAAARSAFASPIDWDTVQRSLAALQTAGRDYLADQLSQSRK
ncbi:polysaccharide pyruvyl transferase family protein [Bradyrhizobium ottawaense]|uniref:polysaccharide pyruvyl transferase family protein n=1 Tax=Bradyrhizobium ottawaense TaxID=931866 RepID=UPI001BA5E4A3|nr:polysaccharide pyruvyl transferase family protein [Bradyrhizobium ottawaense]MBR1292470.1 polysaccharide pyruvyl transferase family protein [Bradyrhizobium ottawaense]